MKRETERYCRWCDTTKAISEFYDARGRLRWSCKTCRSDGSVRRGPQPMSDEHKERVKEQRKALKAGLERPPSQYSLSRCPFHDIRFEGIYGLHPQVCPLEFPVLVMEGDHVEKRRSR